MPNSSEAVKAFQDLVSQWWVGFALSGLLLLVLGWKMNPYWANGVIAFAWGILVLSAWHAPLIANTQTIPRVLLTTLFASLVGLPLYYVLWTDVKAAPLSILVNTTTGRRPDGTIIAGISWDRNFGELRVVIANPTEMDYENLNLLVKPDVLVTEMGQVTKVDGISYWPDNIPTMGLEQFTDQDGREAANFKLVATDTGYRVRANIFPAMTTVEFVMALVTIRMGTPGPPNLSDPNYAVRIGLKSKTGEESAVWMGSPNHTGALFDKPPVPKEVTVAGKYTSQQIEKRIDEKIGAQDLMKNAAATIRSKMNQK